MPRRDDIHRILILGSGPIVIGQAAEFDYSGTQACKALREEGYEVILVNSNPATIMTDPETADRTYIEPVTADMVERVIERERPDALLPTMGGQTGLNVAIELHDARRAREVRRDDARREPGGHPQGRGPRAVPRGDAPHRARPAAQPDRQDDPGGAGGARRDRAALRHPTLLHARRHRRRRRLQRRRVRRDLPARARPLPDHRGPHRGERRRVEGVRARGDARPRGQRGHHLQHREHRPDGRAHGRLDHGRARADADRSRVPGDARRGDPRHPRDRRRDGRQQHPVRRGSGHRPHGRDRDEPARLALVGAGQQGDGLRRSPRSRPSSPSATRSTSCPTTSRRRRWPASSRRSTTSSRRCRASTSRSSPRPRPSSPRRCGASARRWRSGGPSARASRRRCGASRPGASASAWTRRSKERTPLSDEALRRGAPAARVRSASSGCARRSCAAGRSRTSPRLTRFDPWFLEQMRLLRDAGARARRALAAPEGAQRAVPAREAGRVLGPPDRADLRADASGRCARSDSARGIRPAYKLVDTCAAEFEAATPVLLLHLRRGGRAPARRRRTAS